MDSSNVFVTFSSFPEFCRSEYATDGEKLESVLIHGIGRFADFSSFEPNVKMPLSFEFFESSNISVSVAPQSSFAKQIESFMVIQGNENGGVLVINPTNPSQFTIHNRLFFSRLIARESYAVPCFIYAVINAERGTKSNRSSARQSIAYLHPSAEKMALPETTWSETTAILQSLGRIDEEGEFLFIKNHEDFPEKLPVIQVAIELEEEGSTFPINISPLEYLEATEDVDRYRLLIHSSEQPDHIYLGHNSLRKSALFFDTIHSRIGLGDALSESQMSNIFSTLSPRPTVPLPEDPMQDGR